MNSAVMENFETSNKLSLIEKQHQQSSSHSSTIKRNKILIKIFFSLIILLALITGAIITNLIHKYNLSQQKFNSDLQNESVRIFCSVVRKPDSCLASSILILSSPYSETSPDDIFNAFLQIAIKEVTDLTSLNRALILNLKSTTTESRNESGLLKCSSLIDDSLNQLNRSLASSAELPLFATPRVDSANMETSVLDKIRDMRGRANDAWRDLWSCFGILGKDESTAAMELRSGVQNAIMYVSNIGDFLEGRDGIIEQIHYQEMVNAYYKYKAGSDNLLTFVIVFAPQYFLLMFLLCLLLRIY